MSLYEIVSVCGGLAAFIVAIVLGVLALKREEARYKPYQDRFPALAWSQTRTLIDYGYMPDDIVDYPHLAQVLERCKLRRRFRGLSDDDAQVLVTNLSQLELEGLRDGVTMQVRLAKLRQ